ncbi:MAG: FadR family transcriptional regulator [Desulfofustis sp.]|jgi:GntR family transcriptional repressor for pyruvate dehydrogenase complex|nr:FadR family transcriptional regulator [Desulfofustis sp.]
MTIAPIKNIKSEKIQDQVYEQLRTLLLDGHWKAGEKIPSEAELCRMSGVSRVSVRTALKSLIAQGFLVSKQGEGTFVVDVSVAMNMDLLVPIIGLDKKNILEVLEYRKILEVGIVPQIFANLTDSDLDYLEQNVQALEKLSDDQIETNAEIDLAFHRKLCVISGNSLIIKVNQILGNLFRKSMEDVVLALGNRRGRDYHRKIMEAMKRRDLPKTESLLAEHIQDTIDSVLTTEIKPH